MLPCPRFPSSIHSLFALTARSPFTFAVQRDDGPDNGLDGDVDPALDLVRTMSMSTDKDILKQLRDAMNPKQKQQTFIMVLQAGLGLVAVAILLAVVIVGYILLVNVGNAVKTMADQTTELKIITQQTSEAVSAALPSPLETPLHFNH